MHQGRRYAVIAWVLATLFLANNTQAAPRSAPPPPPATHFTGLETSIGELHAPLTIIMYYSLTCPHCHEFQEKALPQIQKDYIDKGLVRFVFRDFPTDSLALKAAKIAWCHGKTHYLPIAKKLLATQDIWAPTDPEKFKESEKALSAIAQEFGITDADYQKCLAEGTETEKDILHASFEVQKTHQINAAPAFIINGVVHEDELTSETIRNILLKMGIHG